MMKIIGQDDYDRLNNSAIKVGSSCPKFGY